MKRFFIVLAILFAAISASAAEPDYPALSGQVVDEAGVLSPKAKSELEQMLRADKDNQIVVATLKNLRGRNGREYGIELARRWQLGQKGKDNGVLILVSPADRYVGIEVGYGLEGVLTDSISGRILREVIIPPLREKNDYNQALLNGAAAVMSVISGELSFDEGEHFVENLFLLLVLIFIIFSRLGGSVSVHRPGRGWSRGFGGRFGGFRGGGGGFGGGGAGGSF